MLKTVRTVVGVAALGLVAAACGTSTPTTTTTASTSAPASTTPGLAVESTSLGSILETSSGHTLYGHTNETATKLNCTGACTSIWVPFTVTAVPTFGTGVNPSLVGHVGSTGQLTYGGHPLYTFSGDTAPHATKGQGLVTFGGTWEAVLSTGKLDSAMSSMKSMKSATTTGSKGYGA